MRVNPCWGPSEHSLLKAPEGEMSYYDRVLVNHLDPKSLKKIRQAFSGASRDELERVYTVIGELVDDHLTRGVPMRTSIQSLIDYVKDALETREYMSAAMYQPRAGREKYGAGWANGRERDPAPYKRDASKNSTQRTKMVAIDCIGDVNYKPSQLVSLSVFTQHGVVPELRTDTSSDIPKMRKISKGSYATAFLVTYNRAQAVMRIGDVVETEYEMGLNAGAADIGPKIYTRFAVDIGNDSYQAFVMDYAGPTMISELFDLYVDTKKGQANESHFAWCTRAGGGALYAKIRRIFTQMGIVHNDLKTNNLCVSGDLRTQGGQCKWNIIDYGLGVDPFDFAGYEFAEFLPRVLSGGPRTPERVKVCSFWDAFYCLSDAMDTHRDYATRGDHGASYAIRVTEFFQGFCERFHADLIQAFPAFPVDVEWVDLDREIYRLFKGLGYIADANDRFECYGKASPEKVMPPVASPRRLYINLVSDDDDDEEEENEELPAPPAAVAQDPVLEDSDYDDILIEELPEDNPIRVA